MAKTFRRSVIQDDYDARYVKERQKRSDRNQIRQQFRRWDMDSYEYDDALEIDYEYEYE